MFASIIAAWNNFWGATKAVSTEVTQRDAELNTVDQRSNAEAKEIADLRTKAATAIDNPDQTDINRMTDQ